MTAGTELLNVQAVEARMFSSYLRHLQVTRANPRELTKCGSCACSAVITERTRGARDRKSSQIDDELERYAHVGSAFASAMVSCLLALCGGRRQLY
jgi:hypothetical protein